jgi:hypothetical protein
VNGAERVSAHPTPGPTNNLTRTGVCHHSPSLLAREAIFPFTQVERLRLHKHGYWHPTRDT